jgi:hypothetical protein
MLEQRDKSMSIQPSDYLPYKPQFVNVSPSTYLVMAHDVLAETPEAMKAVRTLYGIEVQLRKSLSINNESLPLAEGIWKLLNPQLGFKDHLNIQGRFMLRQNFSVSHEQLEKAKQDLAKQNPKDEELLALLPHVRLDVLKDGPSICMLHVGPYSEEDKSFKHMEDYARSLGFRKQGEFHREIYIRDSQTEKEAKNFHTILCMFVKKV